MRTLTLALTVLVAMSASAQHEHHHQTPPRTSNQQPATPPQPASATFANTNVITHEGRSLQFASLIAGKLSVVNFIFTSCTTVCPLMGVRFAQLQPMLPKDVTLLSVSIDPTNDTPEKLAAWARRMGAKPGWTLVTGAKPDIDDLLRSLGTAIADPASHTPLVLILDDRHGPMTMQRVDGLADPRTIAALVAEKLR